MSEQDYIDYFEQLARQNKAIRHSQTEEHFFVVNEGSKAEVEEAMSKRLHLPALLLDQYMDDLDTGNDNYRRRILGGITVLVKCKKGDAQDRRRARNEARLIAESFIRRMRRDCMLPAGLLYNKKIKVETEFKGDPAPFVLSDCDGWGYGFDWLMPHSVQVNPDDWLDLEASSPA